MSGLLTDRVALVTGAGDGIGYACATLLAREGAAVVCVDVDAAAAESAARAIRDAGGQAIAILADVSQQDDTERMVEAAVREFGTVDILHNNAGVAGPFLPAHLYPVSEWDRVHSINVRGVFLGSRAALPVMLKAGHGVIINTCSTFAQFASRNFPAYHASKGAVQALTKQLALDYGPDIRVNSVSPCTIETPTLRRMIQESDDPAARERHYRASNPVLGRLGDPLEVAAAVLFLASDASSLMHGQDLLLGGGQGLAAAWEAS